MDVLAAFIADECVVHQRASAGATRLYKAYKDWCEENGEKAGTQTKFGLRLKERGFVRERSGTVTWHGIGLKADGSPDPGRLGTKNHPDRSEPGHPGPVNRPDGGDPGRLEPNRPSGESGIHTPNAPNTDETPGQLGPENGLNGINSPHGAFMPKKGPNRPNRPEPSGPDELEAVDKASPDARPWPHHPVGCPCPECARRFSRPPAHGDDPGPEPYIDGAEAVF